MDLLIGNLIMSLVPGYIVFQVYTLRVMGGNWRKASWVSAWVMGAIAVYVFFGVFAGSNIVPILLVFSAPVAFVYQLILWFVWRAKGKPA